jgi:hypothetical protein
VFLFFFFSLGLFLHLVGDNLVIFSYLVLYMGFLGHRFGYSGSLLINEIFGRYLGNSLLFLISLDVYYYLISIVVSKVLCSQFSLL